MLLFQENPSLQLKNGDANFNFKLNPAASPVESEKGEILYHWISVLKFFSRDTPGFLGFRNSPYIFQSEIILPIALNKIIIIIL